MRKLSQRLKTIKPFIVMEILEKVQQMERNDPSINIVHMEIGEPDFDTPKRVRTAAYQGCEDGYTHYTHSLGIIELRQAIAEYKWGSRSIRINPENEILVTSGSSPAFLLVLGALINPGDEVIITDPGYPCYINFIQFFGGVVKYIKIYEEDNFNIVPERLEPLISEKTKLLILNSPSNPTGQIISEKNLKKIAELALSHDFYVLSDEIYAELTYTGKIAPSISSFSEMKDNVIVLDGFSKFWAMTGWRLGYLIAPPDILREMNKINQNFYICAPSVSQYAAIEALKCTSETQEMLRVYKQRRDFITKRINEIDGLSLKTPTGAFYAFTNAKEITDDSIGLAWDLVENAHVAATPGRSFGPNGEGFMRFSYCTGMDKLELGLDRIEKYLKNKFA